MEVYSIIADLDQTLLKGEPPVLYDCFIRNKNLLTKYSKQFRNLHHTMFIRKVRMLLKEDKARNSLPASFQSECFDENNKATLSPFLLKRKLQPSEFLNNKYRHSSISGLLAIRKS